MTFKKGDKVLVNASVYTKDRVSTQRRPSEMPHETLRKIKASESCGISRPLMRMKYLEAISGIVVGWSIRKSGEHIYAWNNEDVGYLANEENHKVIMVQPTDTTRWVKPIPCLEDDLEPLEEDIK